LKTTQLKHKVKSNLQVNELPIDASQKQCLKCPPSAWTHAVRRLHHWHIVVTVIEWSILPHSVRHFVYQQCYNYVTTK